MGIATLTKSAALQSPDLHILSQEELRSLQQLLVEMTDDFAQICREHDIPWSLAGGSALGAVRHGGFIPWDDDVDLSMTRADFERFRAVFPGPLNHKYELKLPGDPGYLYHFPKICRRHTLAQNIQSPPGEEECVSIDIFLLENTSNSKLIRTVHGLLCNALLLVDSAVRMKRCRENLLHYGAASPQLCRAVKLRSALAFCFGFLKPERWLRLSDRVFALCKNTASTCIVIPSGNGHYFRELYVREKMETLRPICFEGRTYFVPADTEYLLSTRYGADYMVPPEEQDREYHAFIRFDLGSENNAI